MKEIKYIKYRGTSMCTNCEKMTITGNYCTECGHIKGIRKIKVHPVACPSCKAEVPSGNYCTNCGDKLPVLPLIKDKYIEMRTSTFCDDSDYLNKNHGKTLSGNYCIYCGAVHGEWTFNIPSIECERCGEMTPIGRNSCLHCGIDLFILVNKQEYEEQPQKQDTFENVS